MQQREKSIIIPVEVKEVPSFDSVPEVLSAQKDKALNNVRELYPRDGSLSLALAEQSAAEFIPISERNLLLIPSGMTAEIEAVEYIRPTRGTTIIRSNGYSQSEWYLGTELPERGVRSLMVDASSTENVVRAFQRNEKVDLLFLETVGNEPEMKMPNIPEILLHPEVQEKKPLVIIDSTMTPTEGEKYLKIARDSGLRVIFIQSGTKFFGDNRVLSGIIYSENTEIMDELRDRRKRRGTLLSDASAQVIEYVLPPSKEDFDERVGNANKNTLKLAEAFFECADLEVATIVYPNLPNHQNSEFANTYMPEGAGSVFFVLPNPNSKVDHVGITRALWANEKIRELCRLGQSFGFDETRLWPDDRFPVLRVAGGANQTEKNIESLVPEINKIFKGLKEATQTSIPTGDSVVFGSDNKEISVRVQNGENSCGQACLEMAGYSVDGLEIGEEGINSFHIMEITNDWEWDDKREDLQRGTLSDENVYIVNGIKNSTGNPHWFLVVGNSQAVIDPEFGVRDSKKYLEEEISELQAVIHLPLKSAKLVSP